MDRKQYTIVIRHIPERGKGWQDMEVPINCTYERANQVATAIAEGMDHIHGSSHFWTVDITGEHGSYYQYFHGRTH